jgi:hypothetical protein
LKVLGVSLGRDCDGGDAAGVFCADEPSTNVRRLSAASRIVARTRFRGLIADGYTTFRRCSATA